MTTNQPNALTKLEDNLKTLFLASQSGDQASYALFLKQLSSHLRAYFKKRLTAVPNEIEDLVQEVLLAIHNKKHTYDQQYPISVWIHAIAKYKMIDFFRRNRYEKLHVPIDDADEIFQEAHTESCDAKKDINQLIATLPDTCRVPIQLTKLDGLSISEAAAASGMSESAIKVGIHRGLKKLADLLKVQHGYR